MSHRIKMFPITAILATAGKPSITEHPSSVDTMAKPYQTGTNPCLSEVASTMFHNAVMVLGYFFYWSSSIPPRLSELIRAKVFWFFWTSQKNRKE